VPRVTQQRASDSGILPQETSNSRPVEWEDFKHTTSKLGRLHVVGIRLFGRTIKKLK
jgi:hypothetical protein